MNKIMDTEMSSLLKNPLCPTCSHPFDTKDHAKPHGPRMPLLLQCGHSFCEGCLLKLAKRDRIEISCPHCLAKTNLKEEGSVKSLWPDVYLLGILSANRKNALENDNKDLPVGLSLLSKKIGVVTKAPKVNPCEECSEKLATCKCVKCEVDFCVECFDMVHSASKTLRTHQPVGLSPPSTADEEIPTTCDAHGNRPIEYFCEDDGSPICSHCVIVGPHKDHAIVSMEEKNKKAFSSLPPAIIQATTVLKRLKKSDKVLNSVLPEIQQEMMQMYEKIRSNFIKVHAALQAREMSLLSNIESIYHSSASPLVDARQAIQEAMVSTDAAVREARRMQQVGDSTGNRAQLLLHKLRLADDFTCFAQILEDDEGTLSIDFSDEILKTVQTHGVVSGYPRKRVTLQKFSELDNFPLHEDISDCTASDTLSVLSGSISEPGDNDFEDTSSVGSAGHAKNVKKLHKSTISYAKQELVYVSHIKNPCHFIVQKVTEFERLKILGKQMNKHCQHLPPTAEVPTNLEKDQLVLAKYERSWYRARVTKVDYTTDPADVHVYYVDYGNIEIVKANKLKNIPSKYLRLPEQACLCSLVNIIPASKDGQWALAAVQVFAKMVDSKPMLLTPLNYVEGVLYVDLSKPAANEEIVGDKPVSVREALLFLEYAILEQPDILVKQPVPSASPKRGFLSPEPPKLNSVLDVVISHVVSPDEFYVQHICEEARYLALVMEDLKMYANDKDDHYAIFCPQVGMICAAQFSEDDQWYRAIVTELPGNKMVKVNYVDFGNSEIIPHTRLKKLLDRFLMLPAQTLQCRLVDLQPPSPKVGWPQQAVMELMNLTAQAIKMKVVDMTDDDRILSVLVYDTSDGGTCLINDLLVTEGFAVHDGPKRNELLGEGNKNATEESSNLKPPKGIKVRNKPDGPKMIASHVVNPFEIYLQPEGCEELSNLMASLQATYKDSEYTIIGWTRENYCVAKYSLDEKWYRAKVVEVSDDRKVKVFLLDYGVTDTVCERDVRPLRDNLHSPPAFCLRCHLVDIQPAGDIRQWSKTAIEFLTEKLNDISCYLVKKGDVEEKSQPVDLLLETYKPGDAFNPDMLEYISITKTLLETGLALPIHPSVASKNKIPPKVCSPETDILTTVVVKSTTDTASASDNVTKSNETSIEVTQVEEEKEKLLLKDENVNPESSFQVQHTQETFTSISPQTTETIQNLLDPKMSPVMSRENRIEYYKTPNKPIETELKVEASYIDYDCIIYVQLEEKQGETTLDDIRQFLALRYEKTYADLSIEWAIGQACVCKYTLDDNYYRAQIEDINEKGVKVKYVDYGNSEDVHPDRLRKAAMVEVPVKCHKCKIFGIKPNSEDGKWAIKDLDMLHALLVGNAACIQVLNKGRKSGPMEVYYTVYDEDGNAHDVQELLVKMGAAVEENEPIRPRDTSPESHDKSVIEPEPINESDHDVQTVIYQSIQTANLPKIPFPLPLPASDLQPPPLPVPKRTVASPYKQLELYNINEMMLVAVTEVESAGVVYIQYALPEDAGDDLVLKQITESLNKLLMVNEILNQSSGPPLNHQQVCPGMKVSAMHADDTFYRAEVLGPFIGDYAPVLFVDYGNSDWVHLSRLRELPSQDLVIQLPAQARRCHIAGLENMENNEVTTAEITTLLIKPQFIAVVVNYKQDGTPLITIFDPEEYQKTGTDATVIYSEILLREYKSTVAAAEARKVENKTENSNNNNNTEDVAATNFDTVPMENAQTTKSPSETLELIGSEDIAAVAVAGAAAAAAANDDVVKPWMSWAEMVEDDILQKDGSDRNSSVSLEVMSDDEHIESSDHS